MIRINLISAREAEAASSRNVELIFLGIGLIALLGTLALSYLSSQGELQTATEQVEKLEGDVQKIRKQNQEITQLEQKKRDVEKKLTVVRTLTSAERRSASVHILDDLSSSTPEYLWLTDFTEIKGAAKITGRAVDNQTIASFARDLARSKYFQKVEIRETAQEEPSRAGRQQANVQSIPVKRFLIEAVVNYIPTKQATAEAETSPENGKDAAREKSGGGA
jgi:type IV pilus assembly protein PilN